MSSPSSLPLGAFERVAAGTFDEAGGTPEAAQREAAVRSVRLFLALWPDDSVRAKLAECGAAWDWPAGAALVRPATLHMTLHFLGAVARDRLAELQEGLAMPFRPFSFCLDEPAVWRHGIAVLQSMVVPQALQDLHGDLGATLERLGLPVDTRPLRPHVTLARHAVHAVPRRAEFAVHWPVRDYVLVASVRRGEEGPGQPPEQTYRILTRYGAAARGGGRRG